jgi:hypothetical protein
MSTQMKLDEMLEALQAIAPDKAGRFEAILCATGTEMASILAQHYDCEHGEATMEGVAFAGICAPFMPRYRDQPFPDGWEEFDDGGREEWEAAAGKAELPPMPGVLVPLSVDAPTAGNTSDGPYSPELAEAFRSGARQMGDEALSDKIEVPADAVVRECEGDGALVQCWLYVHDIERAALPGEQED